MLIDRQERRTILFRKARGRAAKILRKSGFALVGGDATPLSEDQVAAVLGRISDEQIQARLPADFDIGDGRAKQLLANIIQWIKDHKEEILFVIKAILTLALLFLEPPPPATTERQDGDNTAGSQ